VWLLPVGEWHDGLRVEEVHGVEHHHHILLILDKNILLYLLCKYTVEVYLFFVSASLQDTTVCANKCFISLLLSPFLNHFS
jgi:hypothetical protein